VLCVLAGTSSLLQCSLMRSSSCYSTNTVDYTTINVHFNLSFLLQTLPEYILRSSLQELVLAFLLAATATAAGAAYTAAAYAAAAAAGKIGE
jgi:hypothetical protein